MLLIIVSLDAIVIRRLRIGPDSYEQYLVGSSYRSYIRSDTYLGSNLDKPPMVHMEDDHKHLAVSLGLLAWPNPQFAFFGGHDSTWLRKAR